MTHKEMVDYICEYYDQHFKFQKFVYDQYIDRELVDKLSDQELADFIEKNCK